MLEFELTLVPYEGDDSWVEGTLLAIKKSLDSGVLPDAHSDCDYCRYREFVGKKLQALARPGKQSNGTLGL